MNLNKELFTKSEFILSFIFLGYFLFATLQEHNFVLLYFLFVSTFIFANIILVLVLLLVTKSKKIKFDERDKFIETKSYRNAYISVIAIINIIIIYSIFDNNIFQPFILFSSLFSTLFISNIVLNLTKIFYYKRGV
ncbi:MAG TPA: hypothetical protein VKA26_14030 [Ignavibacteriaceae bacterium]|nr:hypothetical protein [Ignavibacteriaceae bacterium]